jgi:hypothetical protein
MKNRPSGFSVEKVDVEVGGVLRTPPTSTSRKEIEVNETQ